MCDSTAIVGFSLLFALTLYTVVKSTFKYKINGLIVYIQWGLLLAEALYVGIGAMELSLWVGPQRSF